MREMAPVACGRAMLRGMHQCRKGYHVARDSMRHGTGQVCDDMTRSCFADEQFQYVIDKVRAPRTRSQQIVARLVHCTLTIGESRRQPLSVSLQASLDALLCSDRQTQAVHACLAETSRVLRVGGSFIMLTHRRGLGWHLAACSASYNAVVLQPPRQVGVPLGEGRVPLDGQAPDSASRPLLLASLRGHQNVVSAPRCRSSRPAQS